MASEAVKVIVRCRPMNEREKALSCQAVISMDSPRGQCFIQNPGATDEPPKQFTFDGAYYESHNTEQIYNEIAYPLVEIELLATTVEPQSYELTGEPHTSFGTRSMQSGSSRDKKKEKKSKYRTV